VPQKGSNRREGYRFSGGEGIRPTIQGGSDLLSGDKENFRGKKGVESIFGQMNKSRSIVKIEQRDWERGLHVPPPLGNYSEEGDESRKFPSTLLASGRAKENQV